MEQVKQNINGDTLVLTGTAIRYYDKSSGKLYRITSFPSKEAAKVEFHRETNWKRIHSSMNHPQARIYYTQLIIKC